MNFLKAAVLAGGTLLPAVASAHIDIEAGGTHRTRSAGSSLKTAPCGLAGSTRGTNVHTYRPGATVNLSLSESVPHPGYFRISFDSDGDDDFVIPTGTSGEHGDCGGNASCGPGKEDYCSNETVLLDKLDMHAGGAFGATYTWSVTLPNIECDNCTLQVIQMMNDFAPFHTPATYPADDIYYHCIDLVLSNDAPESTDTPVVNDGMVCNGAVDPVTGGTMETGGAQTATGGVETGTGGVLATGGMDAIMTGGVTVASGGTVTGTGAVTATATGGASVTGGVMATTGGVENTVVTPGPALDESAGCAVGRAGSSRQATILPWLVAGLFLARRRRAKPV